MTTEGDKPEPPWAHVTFRYPVRILLQGKSTAVMAVNAQVASPPPEAGDATDVIALRVRHIYAATNQFTSTPAVTTGGLIIVQKSNIAGSLLLRELPK